MKQGKLKIAPVFEDIMPKEYIELINEGPFGENYGVEDLGSFKELLEEHPLCAGCGLALAKRLIMASLPNPEETIVVGTTGCSSLSFTQLALHNIHSIFGNQNAVASGLKRALKIRFPEKTKDVVVVGGDGGLGDIGLGMVMHSWFRGENFATIMLDNEAYANTGGQESGMSTEGKVLNMAPTGKKYPKLALPKIAFESGCVYTALVNPADAKKMGKIVRNAILIARDLGPTYVQVYCPCPTNFKFKPEETLARLKERRKEDYKTKEFISPEAKQFIERLEGEK